MTGLTKFYLAALMILATGFILVLLDAAMADQHRPSWPGTTGPVLSVSYYESDDPHVIYPGQRSLSGMDFIYER